MEPLHDMELLDCPLCQGPALLEEEDDWCCYVMCLDCGCHTAEIEFNSDADRADSARKAVRLWNMGKVISSSPGE